MTSFLLAMAMVMVLAIAIPVFAADIQQAKAPATSTEIAARMNTVIAEGTVEELPLPDCVITQYSADNGDFVHVTPLENGDIRYEYYCKANEIIYSYIESQGLTSASVQNEPVFKTFDVAAYREANTIECKLSDAQEAEIRGIMNSCNSQEECQQRLDEAGYTNVTVEENNGIMIASFDP